LKRRTSDYDIPRFGSINPGPGEPEGELFNSDVDTENEAGGASYIGDRGHLGFAISHYASNYGVPGSGEEAGVRIDLDQPVTRAQRSPSLEELYNDGPHLATGTFERGDPALDPETANNLDLTLRKSEGRWTWRVSAFANLIEDFIFAASVDANGDGVADRADEEGNVVPEGDLLSLDFVQDDAIFYGIEAETVFGIFEGTSYGGLDARFFADYVRGKLTDGDDLPRITPPRFGGGLDYRFGAWTGDFEVMRVAKQTDNASLETETDGYTQVDLGVSYTFGTQPADLILALRGTNLLNEEERRHTSFLKDIAPLPGRSVLITLRASF